jgi:hypothetical protein
MTIEELQAQLEHCREHLRGAWKRSEDFASIREEQEARHKRDEERWEARIRELTAAVEANKPPDPPDVKAMRNVLLQVVRHMHRSQLLVLDLLESSEDEAARKPGRSREQIEEERSETVATYRRETWALMDEARRVRG